MPFAGLPLFMILEIEMYAQLLQFNRRTSPIHTLLTLA